MFNIYIHFQLVNLILLIHIFTTFRSPFLSVSSIFRFMLGVTHAKFLIQGEKCNEYVHC